MKREAGSRYHIESVARACALLSAFRTSHETLRLQDLADRAELPPSTTLRLVRTLEHYGFLDRSPSGAYHCNIRRAAKARFRIGFVVDSAGKVFRQEVTKGLEYSAAAHDIELVCLDHNGRRRSALSDAEALIRSGIQLVIDFQTGYDVAAAVAEKYLEAGIPMIAIDTPHPAATFYGVNNYVAGRDGGRSLGEWVRRNWNGRVDQVVHTSGSSAAVIKARMRGAVMGLQDRLGTTAKFGVEVLEASPMLESTFHAVQRWLSKSGGGRTIFVMGTDPGLMGAVMALEESGSKFDAAVFGFGGNYETRMALRQPSSRVAGCVGFRPEAYGEGVLRTAIRILEDKPTPPAIFAEHWVLNAENVDLFYPNDLA